VNQIRDLERVTVHTSLKPEFGGAIATISIDGMTASQIVTGIRKTAYFDVGYVVWNGMDAVRISPHIYTSLQELDLLVGAIKNIVGK
jgi:selenocysteine lyase/cysteine desulfurase